MSTAKRTPGAPAGSTIWREGVDPIIIQLRTEQVRQGLSDFRLGQRTGLSPSRLGRVWRGSMPSLAVVRRILTALREANPTYTLTDP
ncbi:MAG: hypothetical protein QY325_04335 [Flavobacteriales bacterium]|nr:MAG: hypothetical protein QY325_04335 [Flavobacteriales bacterium]